LECEEEYLNSKFSWSRPTLSSLFH